MFGIGLRSQHYPDFEKRPSTQLDWLEAISENYMDTQGRPLQILECVRQDYPVALHGVGLSIASSDPVDSMYLKNLKSLIHRIEPFLVSDHLCWTGTASHTLHDLLPFPYTEENLHLIAQKVFHVQDALQRPLLLENLSAYLQFTSSTYTEWEFLSELVARTGCTLLLDVNNVYVSATNLGLDPWACLQKLPFSAISQLHLAGHVDTGTHLYDTHSAPVCEAVWDLYRKVCQKLPHAVPTMIEWDQDVPSLERVEAEVLQAKAIWVERHADSRRNTDPVSHSHHNPRDTVLPV